MTHKFGVLKSGSNGNDVIVLQSILRTMHFLGKNGKVLDVDGDFGVNTEYAVKNFQRFTGYFTKQKIPITGVVDQKMWTLMIGD